MEYLINLIANNRQVIGNACVIMLCIITGDAQLDR